MRPESLQRLADMGIDVWRRRDVVIAPEHEAHETTAASPAPAAVRTPRVRVASGGGDWLLVQEQPWAGHHDSLLADIQATIGPERCAFGQWADSDMAGVAVDELDRRGVRYLLVFGAAPAGAAGQGVLLAPPLDELANSAQARKKLWRVLAPALDS